MDSTGVNRPALPPIQYLDSDKHKREEAEYQSRQKIMPTSSMPLSSAMIPQLSNPIGPSSTYSTAPPTSAIASTASSGIYMDSVKGRQDDRAISTLTSKHSLPSLHEALGVQRQAAYPAEPTMPPAIQTAHLGQATHASPSPRRSSNGRSSPHRSYALPPFQPPWTSAERTRERQPAEEVLEYRRPQYPERHQPPIQHRSPLQTRQPYSHLEQDGTPRISSSTTHAPASHFSYGYSQAPTSYPSAPVVSASAPIYQAAATHVVSDPSLNRRPGERDGPAQEPKPYRESIKRHLDLYDFEQALNEITEHSITTLDFGRSYGERMHNVQRAGITPGTLPAITEVEDLMSKSRQTMDALGRIREVLVAQQAAYLQQAHEKSVRLDQDVQRNDSIHQHDDEKGGFANGEPKKRRGRNAAPGRCHSCNRAETPEWRRGPDGARTLCNACGLHYAKLTRKAGANKAAAGGSSLRPKSVDEGSDN